MGEYLVVRHYQSWFDIILRLILAFVFFISGIIVLVIIAVITTGSLKVLGEVPLHRFLTDTGWHPTLGLYGMLPMITGSLLTSIGAISLALPLALSIATAIHFFLNRQLALFARGFLLVTTAMPTVIYGFWGLTELVPLIGRISPPGASLLTGILILTLMILPTTALLIDVAIGKIPTTMINGAYALGASTQLTCFRMALPVVRKSVISAGLLGLGRALGETIIVVMVTGNRAEFPRSLFDPIRTLTANVALEMGYALPLHASALFLSVLLLLLMSVLLVIIVNFINSNKHNIRVDT